MNLLISAACVSKRHVLLCGSVIPKILKHTQDPQNCAAWDIWNTVTTWVYIFMKPTAAQKSELQCHPLTFFAWGGLKGKTTL